MAKWIYICETFCIYNIIHLGSILKNIFVFCAYCLHGDSMQIQQNFIHFHLNKSSQFLNGLVRLPFLELSIVHFGEIKVRIRSWPANSVDLVRLHGCAGWPGSTLVAKANLSHLVSRSNNIPVSDQDHFRACIQD